MLLQGSCHCGAVCFEVNNHSLQPDQRRYCSICRKAGGAGSLAVNPLADNKTMKLAGQEYVAEYRVLTDGRRSNHRHIFTQTGPFRGYYAG
ncbi:MAG: hypothetical protein O2967_11390 [Proteobacteria bacterium]|nr:hypothetical protein [Pseudomonadota bacterium]